MTLDEQLHIMALFIMQFCTVFPFRPKYLPQRCILEYPQPSCSLRWHVPAVLLNTNEYGSLSTQHYMQEA
jgi:hypothetical protein